MEQTPDIDESEVVDIDEPEPVEEVKNELEKPKKQRKPRKPMSDKQKEALKAGRERAKLNQVRRMLKEREERMKDEGILEEEEPAEIKPQLAPVDEEVDSIYQKPKKPVGKKPTKKPYKKAVKKPKVVYVEESSSDEDDSDSEEEQIIYVKRPKNKTNKKQSRKAEPRHYSNIEEITQELPRLIFK